MKLNSANFFVDIVFKFLNFKISYSYFLVKLAINESVTLNKAQLSGCLTKITQRFSILQEF